MHLWIEAHGGAPDYHDSKNNSVMNEYGNYVNWGYGCRSNTNVMCFVGKDWVSLRKAQKKIF